MLVENIRTILSPSTTCWCRTQGEFFFLWCHAGGDHWDDHFSYDILVANIGTFISPSMTCRWWTLRRSFFLRHASGENWDDSFFFNDMVVGNIGTILSPSTTFWWWTLGWSFLLHAGGEHLDNPVSYDMRVENIQTIISSTFWLRILGRSFLLLSHAVENIRTILLFSKTYLLETLRWSFLRIAGGEL